MADNYKPSDYNYITVTKDNKNIIIFNTRTGALINLPSIFKNDLENILKSNIFDKDTRLFKVLYHGGCIISNDVLEYDEIVNHYEKRNQNSLVFMSIMTTLDCNMSCTYCFEEHRNIYLTKNDSDIIFKFISKEIKGKKQLQVDFYGGEPLLNIEVIYHLQDKIRNLCINQNINYLFTMTTNGYLLSPEVSVRLLSLGIDTFQITIDGPKIIHDARRILKNGDSSFDVILNNIKYIANKSKVNLRINIDHNNCTHITDLIDELSKREMQNINQIMFKAVVLSGGKDPKNKTISMSNFLDTIDSTIKKASKLGFNIYFEPRITDVFCPVDTENQWVISPDLHLFKCSDGFNPNIDSVGKINSDGSKTLNNSYILWNKDVFLEDEKCKSCIYLPQCFGGCSLKRFVHKKDWCPEESYALDKYIQNLYDYYCDKNLIN